jgi:hypothetical protein
MRDSIFLISPGAIGSQGRNHHSLQKTLMKIIAFHHFVIVVKGAYVSATFVSPQQIIY